MLTKDGETIADKGIGTHPKTTLTYSLEPDVSLTPYRHQAYMVQAFAHLLDQAVADQKPVLFSYTVGTAMSLDQVLLNIYGVDAANHFDESLTGNRIANPLWIAPGTVLRLVTPQVRQ